MLITTNALVLREQSTGESDRVLTLLTEDRGLIRAFANSARRLNNKNTSATSLLAYSRLTVFCGSKRNTVQDAEPVEVFFDLRSDLEKLALAQYFCELCMTLAPREEAARQTLKLMLNSLYMLSRNKRPPNLLKPLFEMRLLSLSGFMPDLMMCAHCGAYEAETMYLLLQSGTLCCTSCGQPQEHSAALPPGVLFALRHIIYSDFSKLFSFSLPETGRSVLSHVSEQYLLTQTGYRFSTLDFYHALIDEHPSV